MLVVVRFGEMGLNQSLEIIIIGLFNLAQPLSS